MAGAMAMADKLPKIRDEDRESKVIYIEIDQENNVIITVWLRVCRIWTRGDSGAHVGERHVRVGQGGLPGAGGRDHQVGGRHGHHPGEEQS